MYGRMTDFSENTSFFLLFFHYRFTFSGLRFFAFSSVLFCWSDAFLFCFDVSNFLLRVVYIVHKCTTGKPLSSVMMFPIYICPFLSNANVLYFSFSFLFSCDVLHA